MKCKNGLKLLQDGLLYKELLVKLPDKMSGLRTFMLLFQWIKYPCFLFQVNQSFVLQDRKKKIPILSSKSQQQESL